MGTEQRCPCGSGEVYAACCGLLHDGVPAETALALMRSRYTAYVRGDVDYLSATQQDRIDRAAVAKWARDTIWLGLEIVATERGGPDDTDGIVEFIARGATSGKPFAQRERCGAKRHTEEQQFVRHSAHSTQHVAADGCHGAQKAQHGADGRAPPAPTTSRT